MVTNKIKELEAMRAKLAALEKAVAANQAKELAGLPAKYGFSDVESFVVAVQAATGRGRGGWPGRKPKAANAGGGRRRTRAKITDEMRAEVKKLTEAGKTGTEIAKTVGISLPSVQNIKKALGLVKKRKK